MSFDKTTVYIRAFKIPLLVVVGLFLFLLFSFSKNNQLAILTAYITIIIGSHQLVFETIDDIKNRQFGLDYIAILAIIVSIITQEYLVGIILSLMLASGRNLEEYAASSAKRSLTELSQRIPHDINVKNQNLLHKKAVTEVKVGEIIVVRKGEVIPLDGTLVSQNGVVDESSLTGEAFPVDKYQGDMLRSGIVNLGTVLEIKVSKEEKDSTYKKIVQLVERAQREKAPIVRLADKYSIYFTIITFAVAAFAYLIHPGLNSILAVLVVATPCPLILATPIALIGGMNAQARNRIIIKRLSSIESLSRVDTVVFDKTGTITFGKPKVTNFEILKKNYDKKELLSIASAIERNSLHPLAKAVVEFAHNTPVVLSSNVKEVVGSGIEGIVQGNKYTLKKITSKSSRMQIALFKEQLEIAVFTFEDQLKGESKNTIRKLQKLGLDLNIFTGDRYETAKELVDKLGFEILLKAEMKPEDKQKGIQELKNKKKTVVMVGDGINDAPALALSDVGIVFASEEQTSASEAADIVILNGDFSSVLFSLLSSKRTVAIAKQSIIFGIGLSVFCMIAAAFGLIPPIQGSLIQEGIDVAVIINALRASKNYQIT